jgi:hypothetical protein
LLSRKSLLLLALLLTLPAVADCPTDLALCRNDLMACANNLQNCGDERQTLTDTVTSLQQWISYQQELFNLLQASKDALSQANLNLTASNSDLTAKNTILNAYITSLETSTLDFGAIPLGFASQKQALYKPGLASNGQPFTGFSYALVGTHAADFSVTGPVSQTASVAGNERAGYVVNFTPTAAGIRTATLQVTASLGTETKVTPIPLSGNGVGSGTTGVSSIVIDPVTPSTLYAGLDGSGVYKKIASADWVAINAGLSNLSVKALAIKADASRLFAGTDGSGVFYGDGSGSWAACPNTGNGMSNLYIRSLTVAGSTLYAGTSAGVFVSTDGCTNWTAMNTGMP